MVYPSAGGKNVGKGSFTFTVGSQTLIVWVDNPEVTYKFPQSTKAGQTAEFTPKVASKGEAKIEYSLVSPPEGATIDSDTGVVTWEVPEDHPGGIEIVTVSATLQGDTTGQIYSISSAINMPVRIVPTELADLHVTFKDNGDGSYTFTKNDESEPITISSGSTASGQFVEKIEEGEKGSIVLVYNDGTKSEPFDLSQTTITVENQGQPDHTVTITSPNGETVTFNVFDKNVTEIEWDEKESVYKVYRSDIDGGKTVWRTIDLSTLRERIAALEAAESPSKEQYEELLRQVEGHQDFIDEFNDAHGDVQKLRDELNGLDDRLKDLDGRVSQLEATDDAWAKCYSGIAISAIPLALAIPLYALTHTQIPGMEQINTELQRQAGIYNPDIANRWNDIHGVAQAAAAVLGLVGTIAAIIYSARECQPYNNTQAAQKTPIGQASSRAYRDLGSSQPETNTAE